MVRILIADTPEGAASLERILQGHECHVVTKLRTAERQLDAEAFDLIVVGLHFDDSQMFELIRAVTKSRTNADKPIICFCSRDTPMSRIMHESLKASTKTLGAWMYLAEHEYNVLPNYDAELRRIMERCLTEESRKEIQQQRLDVHRQRLENKQLRMLLQEQEWSPEWNKYLDCMKDELELLLKEVRRLHAAATVQRASVAASRDLNDRVAEHVMKNENDMANTEENQSTSETMLSDEEAELAAKEQLKVDGQRKDQPLP